MKKIIRIDKKAAKEIKQFPALVQAKLKGSLLILERDGKLEEPFAKKIDKEIFEIRVKSQGQWRALYAYILESMVIVLSAFQKKTQKTPIDELEKARRRLKEYQS